MLRVAIRADASSMIGTGHVMRCLALADALRARGAAICFVSRAHPGHAFERIHGAGFELLVLPAPYESIAGSPADRRPVHAHWLGVDWTRDAAETRAALEHRPYDWLVVDHYALDARWEQAVRPVAPRIAAIDDLADREHAVELLLDQNLVAGMESRYAGLLPADATVLLGPEYALLQAEFGPAHAVARPREGMIRRVLVQFGGFDTHGLIPRVVSALGRIAPAAFEAEIVVPRDFPRAGRLAPDGAPAPGHLRFVDPVPSLAPMMAAADLAIGACGIAAWERLCVGLPALVVSVAENQRPIAEELGRRGLVRYLGHHDAVDATELERELRAVLGAPLDPAWSQRCLGVVDGRGATRVAAVLAAGPETPLRTRPAEMQDAERLLAWANDPATRRNGFSPDRIEPDEGDCVLSFSVSPAFRGKGLGAPLLARGLDALRADNMGGVSVSGWVRVENAASRRIFERLGFEEVPSGRADAVLFRRIL
jgi:UDP-2,4-diacetamido-2,4,6-trideoxy-beta-L-altropyranose hydrolase